MPDYAIASEDVSLVLVVVGAVLGLIMSRRRLVVSTGLALSLVGCGLLLWGVLAVTGIWRPSQPPWDSAHAWAGHLLLPVVALSIGLWLGGSVATVLQFPVRFMLGFVAWIVLAFCCFSNGRTGYLGMADGDPANGLRFDVLHRFACSSYAGVALTVWCVRLWIEWLRLRRVESIAVREGNSPKR